MPAANAATEAMMGPDHEVYQYVDTLTPTQKIKALCRRAQARFEGLQDFQTANEDLKLACAVLPKSSLIRDTMLDFQTFLRDHLVHENTKFSIDLRPELEEVLHMPIDEIFLSP